MRLAKASFIVVLPLAVLAIAGCGGSDSTASAPTTTETTQALSKADLISKGDAICAEVNAGIGSLDNAESEAANTVIQVSDLYINMVDSIKSLGTPEDSAGYAEFIAAGEELAKVEGEAKLAAERGDSAALGEAATRAAPALEEFEATAGAYGFQKCSEGPRAPTPSSPSSGEAEEGGVEVAPEASEEGEVEEAAPEEVAPETGGAGGGVEEVAPEGGGTSGGGTSGGGSGGVGPG